MQLLKLVLSFILRILIGRLALLLISTLLLPISLISTGKCRNVEKKSVYAVFFCKTARSSGS